MVIHIALHTRRSYRPTSSKNSNDINTTSGCSQHNMLTTRHHMLQTYTMVLTCHYFYSAIWNLNFILNVLIDSYML